MIVEVIAAVCVVLGASFLFWYRHLPKYRIGNFPSPPGAFLLGHSSYLLDPKKSLQYFHEILSENDGICKIVVGPKVYLVISNYECVEWLMKSTTLTTKLEEYGFIKKWVGNGLLLSSGEYWYSHRKILTPSFHFQMVEKHIGSLENCSDILIEKLKQNSNEQSFDIYPFIANFALDAICESALSTSVNAQENDNSEYVGAVRMSLKIAIERFFSVLKTFDLIFRFYPDYKVFNDSIEKIHEFDKAVIAKRRKILKDRQIESETISENVYETKKKIPFLDVLLSAKHKTGEPMRDHEIREEVDTIVFAGYETTSSAISFVLYNLAHHMDVQNQAYEEQKALFEGRDDSNITYSFLSEMKYLEMVIKETLRLYPPVPYIGRRVPEDTYYKGELLPKDLGLLIVLNSIHRNPELFPEPDKFDPSRFQNDTLPYAFIPFSAGQRNCIGQKFAMVEVKQVISKIIRNFEILPSTPVQIVAEATLKSANGICVQLRDRKR